MSYTEFIYTIGDLLTASYAFLRAGNNAVNTILIVVGVVMMIWWIGQMSKYNKEAKQNGTLK